jgi:hypothetical protein
MIMMVVRKYKAQESFGNGFPVDLMHIGPYFIRFLLPIITVPSPF